MKPKCLISIHPGHFITGSPILDKNQNFLIYKYCNIKIFDFDYPKNNFNETIKFLSNKVKELSKKYKIYLIGRSSGGYLTKVLIDLYPDLIEKAIYLSPVFNPTVRQQIHPRFKKAQDFYFRYTHSRPKTSKFNPNKEFIFRAYHDEHVPIECFTDYQKKFIKYFNKTHSGLCFTTNIEFIKHLCKIIN